MTNEIHAWMRRVARLAHEMEAELDALASRREAQEQRAHIKLMEAQAQLINAQTKELEDNLAEKIDARKRREAEIAAENKS